MAVELDADADTLAAIYQHINVTWLALGASEPHWSVLTHPEFKHEAFTSTATGFMRRGGRISRTSLRFCAAQE